MYQHTKGRILRIFSIKRLQTVWLATTRLAVIREMHPAFLLVLLPLMFAKDGLHTQHSSSDWESTLNDFSVQEYEFDIEPRPSLSDLKTNVTIYECGKHNLTTGSRGMLTSPNFGISDYPSDYHCRWTFQAIEECKLSIKCASINVDYTTDCVDDYLQIFADEANGSNETRYCGEYLPEEAVTGNINATAIFHSNDDLYTDIGFACVVTCKSPPTEPTPSPEPLSCKCGDQMPVFDSRIVGGFEAKPNAYPWLAGLKYRHGNRPFCGAALINNRYVLTAAHCLDDYYSAHMYHIVLYDHNLLNVTELPEGPPIIASIEKIFMHENYDPFRMDSDIALLKLVSPIDFNEFPFLSPICLPNKDIMENLTGTEVVIAGWGATAESGRLSNIVLETTIKVMDDQVCKLRYPNMITSNMVCAGLDGGGKDTCKGDSGGPLMLNSNESWTIIGVVSWGVGCGRVKRPGVYTRVTEFLPWIEKHTQDSQFCLKYSS